MGWGNLAGLTGSPRPFGGEGLGVRGRVQRVAGSVCDLIGVAVIID